MSDLSAGADLSGAGDASAPGATPRLPYHGMRLRRHGSLAELTRGNGKEGGYTPPSPGAPDNDPDGWKKGG